jgi:hypothetical protein
MVRRIRTSLACYRAKHVRELDGGAAESRAYREMGLVTPNGVQIRGRTIAIG